MSSTIPETEAPAEPVVQEQSREGEAPSSPSSLFGLGYELGEQAGEVAAAAGEEAQEEETPGLATLLRTSLASGNIWQAAGSMAPFFLWACFIAGTTSIWAAILRIHAWTLRAAMGGALYFVTGFTVLTVMASRSVDYLFPGDPPDFIILLLACLTIAMVVIVLPWQMFWFVKSYTQDTAHRSGLLTVWSMVSFFALSLAVSILVTIVSISTLQANNEAAEQEAETVQSLDARPDLLIDEPDLTDAIAGPDADTDPDAGDAADGDTIRPN